MGKGSRNRAKRSEEARSVAAQNAAREAVGELLVVQTLDEYLAVLERRPELGTQHAIEHLRQAAEAPGYGPLVARAAVLLDGAHGADASAAWAAYREAAEGAERRAEALKPVEAEIALARDGGDYRRVLELVDHALPIAIETGFGLAVCELLGERGLALYNLGTVARADELDASIEAFTGALEVAVSGEQAARLLMHLGMVFGERIHGDRADNVEHAVAALRDALSQLAGSDDEELRATVRTNLSVALARGERGDRLTVLREAAELCREALRIRNPERDADDWAYSQLNLGEALRDLAALGDGDVGEARTAFQAVIDHATDIRNMTLVGVAHQMLGQMDLAMARPDAHDYVDAHSAGRLDDVADNGPVLRAAREHLQAARDLISRDPIRRGRVLDGLREAFAGLGEIDEAVAAAREALLALRPTTAPDACKSAAWGLGWLLAERQDWHGAADAMREAVEAAALSFHARMDTASRELELRNIGNLHRWAAYAIARAGDPAGAAVVLDAGRGREFSRRAAGDAALTGVPVPLRDDYRSAVRALAESPLGSDSAGASRSLQQVIAAIRQLPGYDRFGAGPQWEELTRAVDPNWPLVYVNPAPSGTLLLALWPDRASGAIADATFISTTSNEVFMRLVAGDAAAGDVPVEDAASYMFSIGGGVDSSKLASALDQLLPWLGEAIGRPIAELLSDRGATSATLVVCGPLGLAPLHAAFWHTDSGPRCLADTFDLRFATSAVIGAAAARRAERRHRTRLVALADPLGDLPAARPEVEEIAALFGTANAEVAVGDRATAAFLRGHAPRASHVHLVGPT